jgi:hypothetical protein
LASAAGSWASDACDPGEEIAVVSALDFGVVSVKTGAGGALVMGEGNHARDIGSILSDGRTTPAVLSVCGEAQATMILTLQPERFELRNGGGGSGVFIDELEVSSVRGIARPLSRGRWKVQLDRAGSAVLEVKGVLHVTRMSARGPFMHDIAVRIERQE